MRCDIDMKAPVTSLDRLLALAAIRIGCAGPDREADVKAREQERPEHFHGRMTARQRAGQRRTFRPAT
jgi:hypothetical protein